MIVSSLAELGDTEHNRREIYRLNRECSADISDRGEFFSYDEYVAQRFVTAGFRADGQLVAIAGGATVGLCALSHVRGRDWAFIEMTGVVRAHRHHRLATHLKIAAISQARRWGVRWVRTVHHFDNRTIIAANRALGLVGADFDL